jgi:hypothetical protein
MRIKNIAKTWYRALNLAPGATVEITDHEGRQLLVELPWHFAVVAGAEGEERRTGPPPPDGDAGAPGAPAQPPPVPRPWSRRGRKG